MRIALVIGSLGRGGTESQLVRLAKEFHDAGCDARVFAMRGGPLTNELNDVGVPVYCMLQADSARNTAPLRRLLAGLAFAVRLAASFVRWRPDVCHGFLYEAYVLAIPVAAATRVRCRIVGRRGLPEGEPGGRVFDLLRDFSTRLASATVANAEAIATAISAHGRTRGEIFVIHNGLDIPDAAADVKSEPPVALVVANLISYKGHGDLIDALQLLPKPPRTRLVGEGPERRFLEAKVADAGLDAVVEFEGTKEDAARLFGEVQIAVLCSHEEGLPNAVLEAMAAGVPVVATRVGGIPELVADGVTGLLVAPRNPPELAGAIDKLATSAALRLRLGTAGREAAGQFSWPRCTESHLDLYSSFLARR